MTQAIWNGVFEDLCGVTATLRTAGGEFKNATIHQVKDGSVWFTHDGKRMFWSGPFLAEIEEKPLGNIFPAILVVKEDDDESQFRLDAEEAFVTCSQD